MRRNVPRLGALLALSAVLGCKTTGSWAPMALNHSYQAGTASRAFPKPRAEVEAAAKAALADLSIQAAHPAKANLEETRYEGRTADGRRVRLDLQARGALTGARVRIGPFGDEPLSRALLDRIGVRLGTLPPEALPVEPPSDAESNPYFSREAVPDSIMLRDFSDPGYRDSPIP
ncbi:hypothetical protein BH23PLA1_BH23PLA1_32800 [soil metagenome]